MTETERTPWTIANIRRAAEIWQRDFADHYGDGDGPWGKQGEVFAAIAHETGKTVGSIAGRFGLYGPSFASSRYNFGKGPSPQACSELEKRLHARRRQDLTSSVFGDPPPGYSALDRKRGSALS